jgi:hypothetical protein
VLGPILFQILVSDLLEGLDVDFRALYADDMSFIVSSPPGTALLLFGFKRLLIFYQNDL